MLFKKTDKKQKQSKTKKPPWDWNTLYVLLFAVHAKTFMGTRANLAS